MSIGGGVGRRDGRGIPQGVAPEQGFGARGLREQVRSGQGEGNRHSRSGTPELDAEGNHRRVAC